MNTLVQLFKSYRDPRRQYHNFQHIQEMFKTADTFGRSLTDEQELAILFHDVEYTPGNDDNEQKSVEFFQQYCFTLKAVSFDSKIVKQIILDTKDHVPTIAQSEIVIDLDLFPLAIEKLYAENRQKIIDEYMRFFRNDEDLQSKRQKWIEYMLAKDKIFYTSDFERFEIDCRINLLKELKQLKGF